MLAPIKEVPLQDDQNVGSEVPTKLAIGSTGFGMFFILVISLWPGFVDNAL